MKKISIVLALALCAVFTADAGKRRCKGGQCGVKKTTSRVSMPTTAAATAWIAPRVNQGAESAQKITLDIQQSTMKLEAELKVLNQQLANMQAQGVTEQATLSLRKKIEAVQEELNKLQQLQNCAVR